MERVLRLSVVIIALVVVVAGVLLWNFPQPPKAYYLIQEMKLGSTKDEIVHSLGSPSGVRENGKTLIYTRTLAWGILYVYLDDEGKLKHYEYDE